MVHLCIGVGTHSAVNSANRNTALRNGESPASMPSSEGRTLTVRDGALCGRPPIGKRQIGLLHLNLDKIKIFLPGSPCCIPSAVEASGTDYAYLLIPPPLSMKPRLLDMARSRLASVATD